MKQAICKLSLSYKTCILLCEIAGLLMHLGIIGGEFTPSLFRMFTVQSNCLVLLYYLLDLRYLCKNPGKSDFCPCFKFAVTLSILLTGLVSVVLLGDMFSNVTAIIKASLILLHMVVPAMVLLDWLLFGEKGTFNRWMPLYALAYPLAYCVYIFTTAPFTEAGVRVLCGIPVNYRYPYPFLQIDHYGWAIVIPCILGLAILLYVLGYLIYFVDRKLSK